MTIGAKDHVLNQLTITDSSVNGSLTRDFQLQVPAYPTLRPFLILKKIREDFRNFVFIPGVNDTGDKLSLVSLLPAIIFCRCC
jgi:hypothetical protein